jgi:ribosomal protein L37AE/L43A
MRAMADAPEPPPPVLTKIRPLLADSSASSPDPPAMICERCGRGNVYRMHAVWRCADCGFKTDCCGW